MALKSFQGAVRACRTTEDRDKYELQISEPNLLQRLIVSVELPEVQQQSLDIRLAGNLLTIKAAAAESPTVSSLVRPDIVGDSGALRSCLELVAQASRCDDSALLCGETGTGKELFARAIHQNSKRAEKRFVVVDCSSFPETMAERLLFGNLQKSSSDRVGLVAQAESGTLLLDEVADLSLPTQRLFQKLLQQQKSRPLDSLTGLTTSFRLIVSTNRNLEQMASVGKFNPALLAQLQQLLIEIPPLRKRLQDIDALTGYFLQRLCQSQQQTDKDLSPEFLTLLKKYPWPGNVRELENSLEQALLAAKNQKTLFPKDLPAHIRVQVKKSSFASKKNSTQDQQQQPFCGSLLMVDNPL